MADSIAPAPDLNVLAARAALDACRAALARGLGEEAAWREGVEVFALHHRSWPQPLAEREAGRLAPVDGVGALCGPPTAPPVALLIALAKPT